MKKENIGSLKLGGQSFVLISVNIKAEDRDRIPHNFVEVEGKSGSEKIMQMIKDKMDDEGHLSENDRLGRLRQGYIDSSDPVFNNVPGVSPGDVIEAITSSGGLGKQPTYYLTDPHFFKKDNGGYVVRILIKGCKKGLKKEQEFITTSLVDEFLNCFCYLYVYDNRGQQSESITFNFAGPQFGKFPRCVAVIDDGDNDGDEPTFHLFARVRAKNKKAVSA